MRYALLFHYEELDNSRLSKSAIAEGQRAFAAYAQTLHQAEVLINGQVLRPTAASTTVQIRDGEVQIHDGPFIDTKEQLGGLITIDVADMDEAIAWARQAPAAHWGTVEIRPGATHLVEGSWMT